MKSSMPMEITHYLHIISLNLIPTYLYKKYWHWMSIRLCIGELFYNCSVSDTINSKLQSQRWESPTPIQRITWPQVLSGRDVVGIAQTGSGKTLGVSRLLYMYVVFSSHVLVTVVFVTQKFYRSVVFKCYMDLLATSSVCRHWFLYSIVLVDRSVWNFNTIIICWESPRCQEKVLPFRKMDSAIM